MRKSSDDLLGIEARIERNLDLQISLDTSMLTSLGRGKTGKRTSIAPSLKRP